MASIDKASVEELATAVAAATVTAAREARAEERPIEHARPSKTSAFNPTGGVRPKLKRSTIFCGAEQEEGALTNDEIDLFNRLKAGRYNKARWQVIVRDDGMNETHVEVKIPISTTDQRMELPSSLVTILQMIVTEGESKKLAPAA